MGLVFILESKNVSWLDKIHSNCVGTLDKGIGDKYILSVQNVFLLLLQRKLMFTCSISFVYKDYTKVQNCLLFLWKQGEREDSREHPKIHTVFMEGLECQCSGKYCSLIFLVADMLAAKLMHENIQDFFWQDISGHVPFSLLV